MKFERGTRRGGIPIRGANVTIREVDDDLTQAPPPLFGGGRGLEAAAWSLLLIVCCGLVIYGVRQFFGIGACSSTGLTKTGKHVQLCPHGFALYFLCCFAGVGLGIGSGLVPRAAAVPVRYVAIGIFGAVGIGALTSQRMAGMTGTSALVRFGIGGLFFAIAAGFVILTIVQTQRKSSSTGLPSAPD